MPNRRGISLGVMKRRADHVKSPERQGVRRKTFVDGASHGGR